jgi:PAS domain S-box-containing protein
MTSAAPVTSPTLPSSASSPPGGMTEAQWAPIQQAFALFDQQSRQLQTAYQSLKQDLARSNETLQVRNRELTSKIQELRQVSSRLESVLESMTDGLLVVGLDHLIERCNSSATDMLGKPRPTIEQQHFARIVEIGEAATALERVLNGGNPVLDRAWTMRHESGESRSLLVSLAPVSAPDGHVLGALCNLRDVTELRRLEKRLHSRERLAALGEMAASVAHEIRNPLGTIEGFARLLRRDLADMPDHLRLAERIVEGAQNLNYVISNLLTYARPMRLHMTDVSFTHLFEVCGETLKDRASRAQVELGLKMPPPELTARGDERQIGQVLLNLGINAIEACNAENGHVHIEAISSRQAVLLQVVDNGCGMDKEQIARVFDPFFTSKEGGTGLGLSLTKKIVDAHGGDIAIDSEPGTGSTFTVTLPREEKAS